MTTKSAAFYYGCVAATLMSATGCAKYHAMPLTTARVENALAPPPAETLRVEAKALRHPLLPAVELDTTKGLSPDEAAVLAVLINPTLRAARTQRQASAAQLLQAGILPNPELSG